MQVFICLIYGIRILKQQLHQLLIGTLIQLMAHFVTNTQPLIYTEYLTHKEKQMPTKLIVDCSTGVTTEVELTAAEIAEREAMAAEYAVQKAQEDAAEAAAKAAAKASATS
jgi:hypothetical protein